MLRSWRATVLWSWGAILVYAVLTALTVMYVKSDPAAHKQINTEIPMFVYEVSMSAFFTAMCMNLTSFLMESSRAKRQLALLCAITKAMAALSDLLVLMGWAGYFYGPGHILLNANRFVQWVVTTPTMIFMLAQISPMSPKQVISIIVVDVAMVTFGFFAAIAPATLSPLFYCLALAMFWYVMSGMSRLILSAMHENDTPNARRNLLYTMFGTIFCWVLFPAIWLLPWCMLPVPHEIVGELVTVASNFLSKVLLSTSLIYGNYAVLEERDKQEMQTLIVTMRSNLCQLVGERDELLQKQEVLQAELEIALHNYVPSTIIDEGTPADKILQVLTNILEGRDQVIVDVVYVRNIILETKDIYVPVDLSTQLQSSKLDEDVSNNLLAQLTTKRKSVPPSAPNAPPHAYTAADVDSHRFSQPLHNLNTTASGCVLEDESLAFLTLSGSLAAILDIAVPPTPMPTLIASEGSGPRETAAHLGIHAFGSTWQGDDNDEHREGLVNDLLDVSLLPAREMDVERTSPSAPFPLVPSIVLQVERVLATACKWHFNVFLLSEASNGHPLSTLAYYLFHTSGLISAFAIEGHVLARFLRRVEEGYGNNPYHNCTHAADVLQTLHVVLHGGGMVPGYADRLMLLACYLAAIVHDFEHVGRTNDFLVQAHDELALRYNDRAPLENHHLAAAFALLRDPTFNFLAHLQKGDTDCLRKTVIDLVLSTDMKQHFSSVSLFNAAHRNTAASNTNTGPASNTAAASAKMSKAVSRVLSRDMDVSQHSDDVKMGGDGRAVAPGDEAERMLALQMALKCADIGHIAAELSVHISWVSNLEEEFFRQGDQEKALGLPVSPLFDRSKPGITKSQLGFFDVVAIPLFRSFTKVFAGAQPLISQVMRNYKYWQQHQHVVNDPTNYTNSSRSVSSVQKLVALDSDRC